MILKSSPSAQAGETNLEDFVEVRSRPESERRDQERMRRTSELLRLFDEEISSV